MLGSVSILCLLRRKMIQELQHARLPCPSLSSGVCSDSCPLSWWHYLTISSSDSSSPFAFNLSQHQGLFQWVISSHLVAKVLEFNSRISPSNEYSGLISFRIDWLDLLAVQGTLKSLFQNHNLKASILQHSVLHYGPTLTSVHDYWKTHSFDYMGPLLTK